jgi:voltage-dependent anion channel protein 2
MSLPQPVPPSWKACSSQPLAAVSSVFTNFRTKQDLGKSSSDLLNKDFPITGASLEVKTKTPSNVSFKVFGASSAGDNIAGDIEAKYVDPKNGLTLTQAWTTSNTLKSQVELENQIAKGLKFEINSALVPDKGTRNADLRTVYKQPGLHSRALLDVFKVCH